MVMETSYEIVFNEEEMSKILTETIEKDEKFQPYSVIVDSPHAQYVEYGSPPIVRGYSNTKKDGSKRRNTERKEDTELYKAIKKWYKARNQGVWSDEDVYLIYRKVLEKGTPPQPFIRPARYDLESEIQNADKIGENNSFKDFAVWLKERMIHYLEENHTIYVGGSIKDKIYIEPTKDGAVSDPMPMDDEMFGKDYAMYADYKGDAQPAMERRENLDKLRWK